MHRRAARTPPPPRAPPSRQRSAGRAGRSPPRGDRGRDLVHHLLGLIVVTIEGFSYHREWQDGRELALEFTGRVDGLDLQGIDLIRLDERQRIQSLDVMIRPINAVVALRDSIAPRMAVYLAQRGVDAASR